MSTSQDDADTAEAWIFVNKDIQEAEYRDIIAAAAKDIHSIGGNTV